jgi:diadenosine tetraphosphate (Ap4A) HIT family hydrolase
MKCPFCNQREEYKKLNIKDYNYWRLMLHEHQCYLGRSIISLKRHDEDIFNCTKEELEELREITIKLRNNIKSTFKADMFNYCSLGNGIRHVHLHLIPRYSKPVNFDGVVFTDERWGLNYAPHNTDFKVNNDTLLKIVEKIKSGMR